jgi:hypothetical protein
MSDACCIEPRYTKRSLPRADSIGESNDGSTYLHYYIHVHINTNLKPPALEPHPRRNGVLGRPQAPRKGTPEQTLCAHTPAEITQRDKGYLDWGGGEGYFDWGGGQGYFDWGSEAQPASAVNPFPAYIHEQQIRGSFWLLALLPRYLIATQQLAPAPNNLRVTAWLWT